MEQTLRFLDNQIENLKTSFHMFFSGELQRPPEKDRQNLEKAIHRILQHPPSKSAQVNLLMQNLTAKFNLFNNMWAKRLNEIETGMIKRPKAKTTPDPRRPDPPEMDSSENRDYQKSINLNLNNESSFEFFVREFRKAVTKKNVDQDKIVNDLKLKMISENMISARADLSVEQGKVKIKIKRSI
jgi:hypothetical protein